MDADAGRRTELIRAEGRCPPRCGGGGRRPQVAARSEGKLSWENPSDGTVGGASGHAMRDRTNIAD